MSKVSTPRQRVESAREMLEGTNYEVSFTARDREHIVQMSSHETQKLREWLAHPSGSFSSSTGDVAFDAVQGGGVLVRTQPYAARQARQKARLQATMNYCNMSPDKQHNSVQAINGDTNEPMDFRMCGHCGRREYL